MTQATIYIPTRPGYYGGYGRWYRVLSPNARVSWHMRNRVLIQDKEFGRLYWLAAVHGRKGWRTPAQRVHVDATFHFPDSGRRRDMDNLVPTLKGIIDGLVLGGCVVDDSTAHMALSVRVAPERAACYGVTLVITKEA